MKLPLLLVCVVCVASCQRATVDESGARIVVASTSRATVATGVVAASLA